MATVSGLASHARPHLAVDLVILTLGSRPASLERPTLGVVVLRRADHTAVLPGRFVRERHTVDQTVLELLRKKVGYDPGRPIYLEMLGVYDAPQRDERGWVVSVSHLTALLADEADRLPPETVEILPVHGDASRGRRVTRESLAYDHDQMVTTAVRRARRRYERSPDPLRLVRPPYTLSELRHVHEAVLGQPLKRDTFNRRMQPNLETVRDSDGDFAVSDTGGRPAQLFEPRSRQDRDPEAGPFPLPRTTG